jgi:hypothetical protein
MGRIFVKKNSLKTVNVLKSQLGVIGVQLEKNKSSICFQSLRKEDLYKKGKKGISMNFIFFIGSVLFENIKKIRIHNTIPYFNLQLNININKKAKNVLMVKTIKYQNNKTRWL